MKRVRLSLVLAFVMLLGLLPQIAGAQSPNVYTSVTISDITSGAPVVGGVFTTDVSLSVTNNTTPKVGIMGIDLWIRYVPSIVGVDDADDNPANGTQVSVSNQFFGSSVIVVANEVTTCPAGGRCVHLALTHTGSPITDRSGKIATITWAGLAAGNANIRVLTDPGETVLADKDGNEIPINSTTSPAINIVEAGFIRGRVERQGTKTDHADTLITAYNTGGAVVTTTTTIADGTFTVTVPAGGTYLVQAMYNGYLKTQKSSVYVVGGTMNLGTTKLYGGDVNADNNVNILDIVSIINRFGTSAADATEPTDINDDLTVNIFDLTIAAGNFGRYGPVNW
ncbi:MAG: dockerin type I domain-containing protein [Anaerolineae bacterium]